MTRFIKEHESWMEAHRQSIMADTTERTSLMDYHRRKIDELMHERLIHLLVTIFVGLVLVMVFLASLFLEILLLYVLDLIFTILFLFYIRHYYLLENTVQRWYRYPNDK